MRLNNSDRDAFVRAVMDDVPMVDYDGQAEALVIQYFRDLAPACILEAIEAHPQWVEDEWCFLPGRLQIIHTKYVPPGMGNQIHTQHPDLWKKLERLAKLGKKQDEERTQLKNKVRAAIAGCATLKVAIERLPEFEKYLPADRTPVGTPGVPVIANVVTDLMAAGWPKDNRHAAK